MRLILQMGSHAVVVLRYRGFLIVGRNEFLHLTGIDQEIAMTIYERQCFFREQLIAAGIEKKIRG